jgi:hypothetical protein
MLLAVGRLPLGVSNLAKGKTTKSAVLKHSSPISGGICAAKQRSSTNIERCF